MRSNGAVHIGNDTFLATTRDVTDGLLLFSSAFPVEEQVAVLPLDRKARLNPHAALPCTPDELQRYIAAARARGNAKSEPIQRLDTALDVVVRADAASPLYRHALYASPDGHQVAAISNVLRHHYIIDITVEPAAVCALEMPEVVRSVCWHPVTPHILYVLFASGDMMVYDTSRSHIGVVLPRHRRVALRPIIQRCVVEADEAAGETQALPPSSSPTAPAAEERNGKDESAGKGKKKESGVRGQKSSSHAPIESRSAFVSPSIYRANADGTHVPLYEVHAMTSPTTGTVTTASHLANSPKQAAAERKAFDEVIPIDKEPSEEGAVAVAAAGAMVAVGGASAACRRTSQTDLVDLYALPPTASLPVMLLVLSSSGDVYSVHLSDADTLPVVATADAVDDGRVRTAERERLRLAALSEATAVNAEVHHLIRGELAETWDEALAVRGCCIDAAAGTHAVFFCTAHGTVRGAWVSEPDLLARHRVAHVKGSGDSNVSFTVHLDGRGSAVRECLSPAVPSTTHTLTMTLAHNLCLFRLGESGEAAYLLAMPCWDRERRGWSCWQPTCEGEQATKELRHALPLLSTDNAVPSPVALRLPYDTCGVSVAMGESELLLVPEVSAVAMPHACQRRRILSIPFLSLLRSALYARCGALQLQPPGAEVKQAMAVAVVSDAAISRAALLKLVNLVPQCHRRWLRAFPRAEVDAVTVELATLVARQEKDIAQRERMQAQRRERLMARVTLLEGRMSELNGTLDRWQQTLLDAIVHRRGASAVQAANERLGEVHTMLKEWEHQH